MSSSDTYTILCGGVGIHSSILLFYIVPLVCMAPEDELNIGELENKLDSL